MHIEELIEKLIAAVEANTAAINTKGGEASAEESEKPAKRASKAKAEPEPAESEGDDSTDGDEKSEERTANEAKLVALLKKVQAAKGKEEAKGVLAKFDAATVDELSDDDLEMAIALASKKAK